MQFLVIWAYHFYPALLRKARAAPLRLVAHSPPEQRDSLVAVFDKLHSSRMGVLAAVKKRCDRGEEAATVC